MFVSLCGLETMEDWDQETLEKVVESKKNEYNQNKPTDIVCSIQLPYFMIPISITVTLHAMNGNQEFYCRKLGWTSGIFNSLA